MKQNFLKGVGDTAPNAVLMEIPRGISNMEITQLILNEWRDSQPIRDMVASEEYYQVRNTKIFGKKRKYTDEYGTEKVNTTLSNIKIPSAFLRNSVNQKINYAFGKPFSIAVENIHMTAKEQEKDKLAETYLKEWQNWITTYVRKTLKRLGKNAVTSGIGWVYVWIDEAGMLQIIDVTPPSLYPQWADRAHLSLDAIIRDFQIQDFSSGSAETVTKVEYWDATTVERYIDEDGELVPDTEYNPELETGEQPEVEEIGRGHMTIERTGEDGSTSIEALSWGKVPFIAFKANEDELPLLNLIREPVDAYDEITSKTADALMDDIDPIIILKNYDPSIGSLTRAAQLLRSSRMMAVGEEGGADYLKVGTDITSAQSKLESLRKDIREFSSTVDTQDLKVGSNPSGVALKSMYQDLDIYTDGLEVEFEVFIDNLKYFFDRWLEFKSVGTVEQWSEYRVIVTLDRDMLINEKDILENATKLVALGVSQETIDAYNPAIESHEIEEARRATQREKEKKLREEEANALFSFGNSQNPQNGINTENNRGGNENGEGNDGE